MLTCCACTMTRRACFRPPGDGQMMASIGVPIADATMITKSMWESAYDGLHYMKGGNDNWNGHTGSMVFQVFCYQWSRPSAHDWE